MMNFDRITIDSEQMGGLPCIRHLGIPVADLVRLARQGQTDSEILNSYPDLELEDVRQALTFASSMQARELLLCRPW